jgi:NADH-quinone oxidoreductase subunit C
VTALTPATAAARIEQALGATPAVAGHELTVAVPPEGWVEAARFARDDLGCRYFNWLSAVDWKEQGLEVVARVDDVELPLAVTLKARLGPGTMRCPSLTALYRGANWMERECYDMFGIVFDGHPDLRRILLSDDWEGHPLRKDYAVDTPQAPYR